MFGKKREVSGLSDRVDTVIGTETSFTGTLRASGSIRIDGQVNGEIVSKGDVIVGESGRVEATVEGRNIVVAGTIHGNVGASGRLEIAATGKLYGDLSASSLVIDEGAVFHGTSKTEHRHVSDMDYNNEEVVSGKAKKAL